MLLRLRTIGIMMLAMSHLHAQVKNDLHLSPDARGQLKLPFRMAQNLIILPVSLNGSQTLHMVLDSGLSNTIITEMSGIDTLNLNSAREVFLSGLGSGLPGRAFASTGNDLRIRDPDDSRLYMLDTGHDCYILEQDHFSLSKHLGVQVNGLIGADFFRHFVVEIDYHRKMITFHDPETFKEKRKHRKYSRIPVSLTGGKAFVEASLLQHDSRIDLRLLVDTGASLPLWIDPQSDPHIRMPEKTMEALLGQGLNGPINGENGRVPEVQLAGFSFKNPLVAFPDSASVAGLTATGNRNGSVGNEILRRFHVVLDFQGNSVWLKPNSDFRDPFSYNKSGLEVEKPFLELPLFTVYDIAPDSPADLAGLQVNDQITMINGRLTKHLNLDDILSVLHGHHGNTVRIRYNRDGVAFRARLQLSDQL